MREPTIGEFAEHIAGLDLAVDRVAIEQVQSLREVRLHLHFAGTHALTLRPTEGRQEVVAGVAVGNLNRSSSQWQAAELVLRVGDLADRVEKHFGPHPTEGTVREVRAVLLVGGIRLSRQLVSARDTDVADQFLEVVLVAAELASQRVEQRLVDRRIADSNIVDLVDDPLAHEVGPDDVGQVSAEIRVLIRRQPLGEHDASILAGGVGFDAAQELGLHHATTHQVPHLAAAAVEDDRFARILTPLASDLSKERSKAVVVVHRPAVEWMVMALRTLDPHPHEDLCNVFGHFQRVGLVLVIIRRRVGKRATVGSEQFLAHHVHRNVVGDAFVEPVVVPEHGFVADLSGGANREQLGPLHHPHLDEFLAVQQFIDQPFPLGLPGKFRVFDSGLRQCQFRVGGLSSGQGCFGRLGRFTGHLLCRGLRRGCDLEHFSGGRLRRFSLGIGYQFSCNRQRHLGGSQRLGRSFCSRLLFALRLRRLGQHLRLFRQKRLRLRRLSHEPPELISRRQDAGNIEIGTTKEDLVVADFRRNDPQFPELLVDQCIDIVDFRRLGILVLQTLGQHDEPAAGGVCFVASHHECLAAGMSGHFAGLLDLGRRGVACQEERQGRDVTGGAVCVSGQDVELLSGSFAVEDRFLGEQFQRCHRRYSTRIVGSTSLQPSIQSRVHLAVGIESPATGMRYNCRGLFHQQARCGHRQIDPATWQFPSQPVMVSGRIETK